MHIAKQFCISIYVYNILTAIVVTRDFCDCSKLLTAMIMGVSFHKVFILLRMSLLHFSPIIATEIFSFTKYVIIWATPNV